MNNLNLETLSNLKASWKGYLYNVENIYIYDELISIYKNNPMEDDVFHVNLNDVELITK